jgi:Domain of unknown function (DUF6089)
MKKIILAFFTILLCNQTEAQKSSELGISLGTSNYLGDLQKNNVSLKSPGVAFGFFAKQSLSPSLGIRANVNYGRLHAADANSSDAKMKARNLSFRSHVIEFGLSAEVSMLPFDRYNNMNSSRKRYFNWTPYFFGGINVFHFNPKARYNGRWVALQPLNTEGQNSNFSSQAAYSLTQVAIPFGLGVKYQFANRLGIALEMGVRKTFTDYLDDVSGNYPDLLKLKADKGQTAYDLSYRGGELSGGSGINTSETPRGNSANMDWYLMSTLNISYKFYKR